MRKLSQFVVNRLVAAALLVMPLTAAATTPGNIPAKPKAELIAEHMAKQTTGVFPGAHIVAAACDPTADPADDSNPDKDVAEDTYYPLKSCENQVAGATGARLLVPLAVLELPDKISR
ncbi:MAG: hypothetical protein K0R98_1242 [Rickettsiaceae bacterium]|nr:hypothetical protein [Rickettsiaceae bacterium]